jgi:hypothetical protein
MPAHLSRRLTACAAVTAGLSVTALAAPALAATQSGFSGSAYGSTAKFGSTLHSGKSAAVPLCTTKVGAHRSDRSAATRLAGLGTVGAVTTRVASQHPRKGTVKSVSTTHTTATSLAGGAIHASALDTSASVSHSAKGYSHPTTTKLVDLTIAGKSMPMHPSTNQTMSIPTVGSVELNHPTYRTSFGAHSASVTALILTVHANNSRNLPAGKVVIGHAAASLHQPVHHFASGNAYGSTITVGGVVKSGRTAPEYLPCAGSNGKTLTDTTSGATESGSLTTGDVTSKVHSTDSATRTAATTSSRIANGKLLNGVISAKGITTRAHVARDHGKLSRSASGTTIGHLIVQGRTFSASEPTKRTLPGIGTLYLHRVMKSKSGIQVYALELILTKARGNLAKGTTLILGSARAGVKK